MTTVMRRASLVSLVLALLLAGCDRKPPTPQTPTHAQQAAGISWFDGSVDGAFVTAKRTDKPVFLFWGASWCPWCQQIKSLVFSRPDFIAKTRLFVPVYLDGDSEGAQRQAENFHVTGYPTLVVLDADRHEVMRIAGSMDVAQYAGVLDVALADLQPVDALLSQSADHKLSAGECRRLAYNGWSLQDIDPADFADTATRLAAATDRCPANATADRARLTMSAAHYRAAAEADALAHHQPPSATLVALIDQSGALLAQTPLAVAIADAPRDLGKEFFTAVRACGQKVVEPLRAAFVTVMDAASTDARYTTADQLGMLAAKLDALKQLDGKLPADVASAARTRVRTALAVEQDPYRRPSIIDASLDVLDATGDKAEAYRIVKDEISRAPSPYYFEADLGLLAESLGHKDEALDLLAKAYDDSRGAATRFQWGVLYLDGVLRMAPADAPRVQRVGEQVLAELDGEDRIYRRARVRLERLDQQLRNWNGAARGRHADVLQALHARAQQVCVKIPENDPARRPCEAFLKGA
jgi:thioredoxin-related protein